MSTQPANSPSPLAGALATYVHPGSKIGVLVELTCQSEFVAQREEFLQLAHDLAMHVAASDPKFLSRENISPELYRRQQEIFVDEALRAGKLPELARTVAAGQMEKFCRENCLLEQPFIKDPQISITELLDLAGQNLAESIFCTALSGSRLVKTRCTVLTRLLERTTREFRLQRRPAPGPCGVRQERNLRSSERPSQLSRDASRDPPRMT